MLDRVPKFLGHCMVGIGPHHKGVFGPFLWNQRQMKWVIFPPTKHQMVSKSLNQERALGSNREQDFSSRSNIVCASELRLKLEGLFLASNDQRREQRLWNVEQFTPISRQIGRDAEIESSGKLWGDLHFSVLALFLTWREAFLLYQTMLKLMMFSTRFVFGVLF